MKNTILAGAILGALAVIIGAFGAHGLEGQLTEHQEGIYETGNRYHFYHSLTLLIVGLLIIKRENRLLKYSALCFIIGIVFFSGSLYLLACREIWNLGGWKFLGPLTPIGGLFFIIGWILLGIGALKLNKHEKEI